MNPLRQYKAHVAGQVERVLLASLPRRRSNMSLHYRHLHLESANTWTNDEYRDQAMWRCGAADRMVEMKVLLASFRTSTCLIEHTVQQICQN
jgi:hypothetical protein